MKNIFLFFFLILWCLLAEPQIGLCAQKPEQIDPCVLIVPEKIFRTFSTLQKVEKQTIGPNTTCNYLDKYGIPALIISISRAGTTHTRDTLSILGSGYTILDVTGLGDEAAVAVQQANPKFGLQEGVAALHVKKGNIFLHLFPVRLNIQTDNVEFEKLIILAAEMIEKF